MAATFQAQVDALAEKYVNGYNNRDAVACSEVYSEDAIVLLPGGIIRGREAIAADFQTLFKSGLRVTGLTTTHCHSDGKVGYAIQIEHSNRGDTNTLLVFRQDKKGNWLICAEAVIGNG
jgi:uncharacterized protein (TIGR02246 family)